MYILGTLNEAKKFNLMITMAIQQYRVFRLAMVLVIVALTIFLYASYYANPSLTMPGRMQHTAAALLSDDRITIISNNDLDGGSSPAGQSPSATGQFSRKLYIQTASGKR